MDKTQKYIEMCRQAREIQARWVQGKGDWFVDEDGDIRCCVSAGDESAVIRNGFRITESHGVVRLSRYIWLPRLEQLMDMAQKKGISYSNTTHIYYHWVKTPYDLPDELPRKYFTSVEQSWLGFVMQTTYFKKWDGTDWVTIFFVNI